MRGKCVMKEKWKGEQPRKNNTINKLVEFKLSETV